MASSAALQRALNISSSVVLLVVGFYVLSDLVGSQPISVQNERTMQLPTDPLPLDSMEIRGDRTARAGMIVFSDFECTHCRQFGLQTLPRLVEEFVDSNRVRVGFRHFPEPEGHPRSLPLAKAAACAGRQRQFWQAHDAFFANPFIDIDQWAAQSTLDGVAFSECLQRIAGQVDRDRQIGIALDVRGTPVAFIGKISGDHLRVSEVVSGAQPIEVFRRALKRAVG